MRPSTLSYELHLLVCAHRLLRCLSLILIHSVPPPNLPSVPILKLNCFVQGDDRNQIFSVEIANNKSISALRDAIKEKKKPQLDHVTADSLHLWDVSIADDDDGFEEKVSKVVREQTKLSPVDQLSDVFSGELVRKHVHIVVKSPRIGEWKQLVSCWVTLTSTFQPPN